MDDIKIRTINNVKAVEMSTTVEKKTYYTKEGLLRQKVYFESLISKGTAGLAGVEVLLNKIENESEK